MSYYVIDSDKHLWQNSVNYEYYYEKDSIGMTITSSECLDLDNTYSSKSDIEKYLKKQYYSYYGYEVDDIVITITEFTTHSGDKAYYINSSDTAMMKILFWNYDTYVRKNDIQSFHEMMQKCKKVVPKIAMRVYYTIAKRNLKKRFK